MLEKHPEKRHLEGSVCEIHKSPTDGHLGLSFIMVRKCGGKKKLWDKPKCFGIH